MNCWGGVQGGLEGAYFELLSGLLLLVLLDSLLHVPHVVEASSVEVCSLVADFSEDLSAFTVDNRMI